MIDGFYTTAELAAFLGIDAWKIRRLFERGEVAEPRRLGNSRAIPRAAIPQIVDRLRVHGWLPEVEEATP